MRGLGSGGFVLRVAPDMFMAVLAHVDGVAVGL